MFLCSHASDVWPLHDPQLSDDDCHINLILSHWSKVSNDLYYKKIDISSDVSERRFQMTEIEFVGYSAVHPSDFIYDVPNGFTGYLSASFRLSLGAAHRRKTHADSRQFCYSVYTRKQDLLPCCRWRIPEWLDSFSFRSLLREAVSVNKHPISRNRSGILSSAFKLLTWESAFFSSESEANITHLLRVLFSKLREGIQNESPGIHDHELIALHKMIYNNPQLPWNINMMAAKLHLSPSHLQALYHRQFGSSCMDNVIEGRLRRAQDLLEYSEYSIRDISEQCGYNNVEHFCRQFRQHNGCTPGQYRKNASAGSNKRLLTHNTLGGREFEKINRNIRK